MLVVRAREGQRDKAHHPGWDTRRTSSTLNFTASSSPCVGKERLGHSPSGGRLHHVERDGGDRYLKPQFPKKQRPSNLALLQGLSAGLVQTFSGQLSEGFS